MNKKIILAIIIPVIIVIIILVMALIFILPLNNGSSCPRDPIEFTEVAWVELDQEQGSTWSIPVFDGTNIVASCETKWNITLRKYDLDLNPIGNPVEIINNSDADNQWLADHKHIFQNNYHYILFAAWNDSLIYGNGSLYLIQLDSDFNRINFTTVAYNDPPVNDMLLVGDGTNVHAGKFFPDDPPAIHRIRKYDTNLNWIANYSEGINDTSHVNGGSTLYHDGIFYMVAPYRIGPGVNGLYYMIKYNTEWEAVEEPKMILNDTGNLGLINGLSIWNSEFIIHYCYGPNEANPIARAVYDCDWNLIQNETVYYGDNHAPHTIIVNNTMYLGYTNETSYFKGCLAQFNLSIAL